MKTNYVAPQIEVVELELEEPVLGVSGGDVQSSNINSFENDDAF